MSTTTKQPERTFTPTPADELDALFGNPATAEPRKPSFATNHIQANTPAKTFISPNVQPTFNDPLLKPVIQTQYVRKEEYVKAKRSARDAWFAVAVLGAFIAGGGYFIVDRIGGDATKINALTTKVDGLNKQLQGERSVVIARNKELYMLHEQLNDERRRTAAAKAALVPVHK